MLTWLMFDILFCSSQLVNLAQFATTVPPLYSEKKVWYGSSRSQVKFSRRKKDEFLSRLSVYVSLRSQFGFQESFFVVF